MLHGDAWHLHGQMQYRLQTMDSCESKKSHSGPGASVSWLLQLMSKSYVHECERLPRLPNCPCTGGTPFVMIALSHGVFPSASLLVKGTLNVCLGVCQLGLGMHVQLLTALSQRVHKVVRCAQESRQAERQGNPLPG